MKTKLISLAGYILILATAVLSLHTYNQYRADLYIRQATLATDWQRAEMLATVGLLYDDTNSHYLDQAGVLYLKHFMLTKSPRSYQIGRKILNRAHKMNPFDPYILIHIIGMEVESGNGQTEYTQHAFRVLYKLDKFNVIWR